MITRDIIGIKINGKNVTIDGYLSRTYGRPKFEAKTALSGRNSVTYYNTDTTEMYDTLTFNVIKTKENEEILKQMDKITLNGKNNIAEILYNNNFPSEIFEKAVIIGDLEVEGDEGSYEVTLSVYPLIKNLDI